MFEREDHKGLFESLRRLYSRITTLRFMNRLSSYHGEAHFDTGYDLRSVLHAHIDTMQKNHRYVQHKVSAESLDEEDGKKRLYGTELIANGRNEFSRYLHDSNVPGETGLPICDHLREATWEHIHTSLRLAHEGETMNARMHADFADTAMKELSHYCAEDEFQAFNEEVKSALSRIRTE
jgi:hypothetical protein